MSSGQTPFIGFNYSDILTPDSRIYTNDITYSGYVVDIAVLQQNINTITKPEAYIVNLEPLYLSYAGFKMLFYSKGIHFSPILSLTDISKNPTGSGYILNNNRIISDNLTNCENSCSLNLDGSFNLLKTLLLAYSTDLNLATECWDTCSLMEFYNIIERIKGLTDIHSDCGVNVHCALTLDEFFDQLQMQGLKMSGLPWKLPIDPSNSSPGADGRPSVYPGLVTAVITANFHSTTPGVNDVQVRWPFVINFTSVNFKDGSANTVFDKGTSKDVSGGTYPVFLFIDNNTTNPALNYRSFDLSFTTVDLSNNVFFPKNLNAPLPQYTRYNAGNFSKIYWENLAKP
jgi:hypothetical protein